MHIKQKHIEKQACGYTKNTMTTNVYKKGHKKRSQKNK